MNYVDTIKRAFRIAWTHKSLWLLGFLASLGSGGSGSSFSGGGGDGSGNANAMPNWMGSGVQRWLSDNAGLLIGITGGLLCVFFMLWLVFLVLGEIGQGGLIANVDGIERGGAPGFRDGWNAGKARVRTLVGMRLLLWLPGFLIGVIFLSIAVLMLIGVAGSAGRGDDAMSAIMGIGVIGFLCVFFPMLCVFAVYGILTGILETFGRRAIMLENLGAIDGLKRGWAVFRGRIGDSIVLAILMAVVGFVIGAVIFFPLVIFGVGAGVGTAVLTDSMNNFPWALAAIGFLLFLLLAVVLGSFITAVNSAVWTLAWREFTAPPPTPPTPPHIDLLAEAPSPPAA